MGMGMGMGGQMSNMAAQGQMMNNDMQNCQTIQTQEMADAQTQNAKRNQILMDTQTKIFEIQQDSSVNKAKVAAKGADNWVQYIRNA